MANSAPPDAQELFTDVVVDDRPFNKADDSNCVASDITLTQDLLDGLVFKSGSTRADRLTVAGQRVAIDPSLRYKSQADKDKLFAQLVSEDTSEQDAGLKGFQKVVVYTTVNALHEELQKLDISDVDMQHISSRLFTFGEYQATGAQKWAIAKARQFIAGEVTELTESERDYKPGSKPKETKSKVEVNTEATSLLPPPDPGTVIVKSPTLVTESKWFDRFVEFIRRNDEQFHATHPDKRDPAARELGWALDVLADPDNNAPRLKYAERMFYQLSHRWENEEKQAEARERKQLAKVADLQGRIDAVRSNVYYPELWGFVWQDNEKKHLRPIIENPGNWETDGDDEGLLRRVLARAEKEFSTEIPAYVDQLVAELPLAIWFGVDEDWIMHLKISRESSETLSEISVIPEGEDQREFLLLPRGSEKKSRRYKCRLALDELFSSYFNYSGGNNPYRLVKAGSDPYFEADKSKELMEAVFARMEQEREAEARRRSRHATQSSAPGNAVVYVSEAKDGDDEVNDDLEAANNQPAQAKPRRKAKSPKNTGGDGPRHGRRRRGPASQTWMERDAGENFYANKPNPQGPDASHTSRGSVVADAGKGQKEKAKKK